MGELNADSKDERMNRQLLANRQTLEEAKIVGNDMEDMAKGIKFNLRQQSDKLENSTLNNLYTMQKDMTMSNRLIETIQRSRMLNRMVLAGIFLSIVCSILFIIYVS